MHKSPDLPDCPCGSKKAFRDCCDPYIQELNAPTAEKLMRSRYTAFVVKNIDYLIESLHPKARQDVDKSSIQAWAEDSQWLGLQIVNTQKGQETDTDGTVEFIASYKKDGQIINHHEKSTFKKEKGRWWFIDGKNPGAPTIRSVEPKTGRNDPCPCKSGKKYKKCCG